MQEKTASKTKSMEGSFFRIFFCIILNKYQYNTGVATMLHIHDSKNILPKKYIMIVKIYYLKNILSITIDKRVMPAHQLQMRK